MKNIKISLISLLLTAAVSMGCRHNSDDLQGKNVYVVGEEIDEQGNNITKFWKNSKEQNRCFNPLSSTSFVMVVKSGYVSGNDVYVVGQDINADGKFVAKLWKNCVGIELSKGSDRMRLTASIEATPFGTNDKFIGYHLILTM
jgi:hypothetical protein